MTHSEPAREAVALDQRALSAARKVYNESLNIDIGALGATERIVRAYFSASPARGGLEAVRAETLGPYEARICKDIPADCCDYGVVSLSEGREVCRVWREQDARAIAAALAAPAATSAETQGGDGVREAVHSLMEAGKLSCWLDVHEHIEAYHTITAALAPSTSAATRGDAGFKAGLDAAAEYLLACDDYGDRHKAGDIRKLAPPAPAVESAQVKARRPKEEDHD